MRGQPAAPASAPSSAAGHFEHAYRSCGTAVLGYALRRAATREDAFDVVAETFAIAWRRHGDLPAEAADVRPWLFGIARRCLSNTDRGIRRADRLGERLAAAYDPAAVPDPAALHEVRVESRRVREALAELSPDDRELVTLVAWEGLAPAEAATVLGLTAGAARVRLHRARTRLRAVLSTAHDEETDRDH